jgi:hypothetical protein
MLVVFDLLLLLLLLLLLPVTEYTMGMAHLKIYTRIFTCSLQRKTPNEWSLKQNDTSPADVVIVRV